jgi:hypothetical protein
MSAFKPHELTQQFYDPTTNAAFGHYAPWNNTQTRLHRVFELISTASRAAGVRLGGRYPGKININMVNDKEVFEAICDAQAGNAFMGPAATPQSLVDALFANLVLQRTPGNPAGSGIPGPNDQPFWSLATGFSTGLDAMGNSDPLNPTAILTPATATPRGINNTLLRFQTSPPLAAAPPANTLTLDPFVGAALPAPLPNHPYLRNQLLTKIYNTLTTRSNVFAVYLTVGFFEVAKDAAGNYVGDAPGMFPVQLGAEIGRAEGRQIRHRMLAIVDRTNLQAFSTSTNTAITVPSTFGNQQFLQTNVTLGAIVPTNSNPAPSLQPGMVLVFDPNTDNEETVVVQAVPMPGQITATFQRSHPLAPGQPTPVICRGNPGPWTRYDPRQDPLVVPYFAIID